MCYRGIVSDSTQPTPHSSPTHRTVPADVERALPSAHFGHFVRVAKLGAGGMGEVWKAWDSRLNRWVALKFLKGTDDEEIARFLREAQLAGQLSHPHIAAIYDVGQDQGQHFIAMQFVEGQTLKTFPRGDRKQLARLIRDGARAVAFAHERGVVHRDLKPENLMVTPGREPHLYVMDFGLARATEGASDLSISGQIVGTPGYMSPEQARGGRAGPRSDVWSLGATLYHLVADTPPFRGANVMETLRKVTDDDPKPPRAIEPRVDVDLETIVLKCLDKDPARRYASAGDLADDLDRWLNGEAIAARPTSLFYRLRRAMARRKGIVAALLVGAAAVLIVLLMLIPALRRSDRALTLWSEVSVRLADAEGLARAGEQPRAFSKLDEGIARCRASIERDDFPLAHFFLARLLIQKNEIDEAKRELDRALALDPGLGEAKLQRGLLRAQDYDDGVGEWRQLLMARTWTEEELEEKVPALKGLRLGAIDDLGASAGRSSYFKEEDAIFGRGILARGRRQTAEARRAFEEVVRRNPLYVQASAQLAILEREAGHYREAAEIINEALARHRGCAILYELLGSIGRMSGEDAGAAEAFREAKRLNPSRPAIDDLLCHALALTGRRDEGLAILEDSIRRRPRALLNSVNLAVYRFMDHRHAESIRLLDDVMKTEPLCVMALVNRASVKATQGDMSGAIGDLDAAIRINGRCHEAFCTRGDLKIEQGDVAAGMADLDEAVRLSPGWTEPLLRRAQARLARGEFEAARADVEALERLRPDDARFFGARGYLRLHTGDPEKALADFDHLLKHQPGSTDAILGRADALAKLGRYADAVAALKEFVEVQHDDKAQRRRAGYRILLGDYAGAIQDCDEVLRHSPRDADAFYNRALAELYLGRRDRAIADCAEALAINPRHAGATVNRGYAREEDGDVAGARRDYEEALRFDPRCYQAYLNLGSLKARSGEPEAALRDFGEAARIEPGRPEAHENLGILCARLSRLDEALRHFDRAVAAAPKRAKGYLCRGEAWHRAGEFAKAVEDYTRALELEPNHVNALANRGRAKLSLGDLDGAKADLRESLKRAPSDWPIRGAVETELKKLER